jgi:outer membrane protein OmpA-like peptidoglycan-associated protein
MPQELSTDRAKAVEQFYVDNGIARSRFVTVGKGLVAGLVSRKEGLEGYRRVDTLPIRQ